MPQTSTALPFFHEGHQRLAGAFRSWVDRELTEFQDAEGGDGADAARIFGKLGADGWLAHTVAATSGAPGQAPDLRTVCLMREALAYSSVMADVAFSEPWLGMLPLLLFGSASQHARYLAPYLAGGEQLAFALSEPEAGSDVAAIGTVLSPTDGAYAVEGRKTWTSNAGLADAYVVFGRLPGSEGRHGLTAVLVDGARPEVVLEERIRVLSPHTVGTLGFRRCPTTWLEPVVGAEGQGFEVAMRCLALFRPTVAAACVGFARRALDEALARCHERVAFGRPIAQHQMIQAKLADMAVKIDAAALLTYQAAWQADTGSAEAGVSAAMAKLHASEIAGQVVDEALQIFGGAGVVQGAVVERLYRHVRAFRIFDGTSEIQKLIIARALLQRGAGPAPSSQAG